VLATEIGRGFGEKNLRPMVQFVEAFPDAEIVAALLRQLSWTHFTLLIPLEDPLKREFYAEMCRVEGWSTRALQVKIDGMLFERTALSRKPEKLVREELRALREDDRLTPDLVFQDPYLLDFLGLRDTFSEKGSHLAVLHKSARGKRRSSTLCCHLTCRVVPCFVTPGRQWPDTPEEKVRQSFARRSAGRHTRGARGRRPRRRRPSRC